MTTVKVQHYLTVASEEAIAKAERDGFVVIRREPSTILIDLDGMGLGELTSRLRICSRKLNGVAFSHLRYWESKTAGHYHAEVTLSGRTLSDLEAIALQAILGSDFKRELAALNDLQIPNPHWSVLFRPPTAKVVEVRL